MTLHEIPGQSVEAIDDIVARLRNMADRIEAGLIRPDLALQDGMLLAATPKGSFGEVEA